MNFGSNGVSLLALLTTANNSAVDQPARRLPGSGAEALGAMSFLSALMQSLTGERLPFVLTADGKVPELEAKSGEADKDVQPFMPTWASAHRQPTPGGGVEMSVSQGLQGFTAVGPHPAGPGAKDAGAQAGVDTLLQAGPANDLAVQEPTDMQASQPSTASIEEQGGAEAPNQAGQQPAGAVARGSQHQAPIDAFPKAKPANDLAAQDASGSGNKPGMTQGQARAQAPKQLSRPPDGTAARNPRRQVSADTPLGAESAKGGSAAQGTPEAQNAKASKTGGQGGTQPPEQSAQQSSHTVVRAGTAKQSPTRNVRHQASAEQPGAKETPQSVATKRSPRMQQGEGQIPKADQPSPSTSRSPTAEAFSESSRGGLPVPARQTGSHAAGDREIGSSGVGALSAKAQAGRPAADLAFIRKVRGTFRESSAGQANRTPARMSRKTSPKQGAGDVAKQSGQQATNGATTKTVKHQSAAKHAKIEPSDPPRTEGVSQRASKPGSPDVQRTTNGDGVPVRNPASETRQTVKHTPVSVEPKSVPIHDAAKPTARESAASISKSKPSDQQGPGQREGSSQSKQSEQNTSPSSAEGTEREAAFKTGNAESGRPTRSAGPTNHGHASNTRSTRPERSHEGQPGSRPRPVGSGTMAGDAAAPQKASASQQSVKPREAVPRRSTVMQIEESIYRAAAAGRREITLRLRPRALGNLNVHLSLGEKGLMVQIKADNQATKTLIEAQLKQLHAALENRGMQLEGLSVVFNPATSAGNSGLMGGHTWQGQPNARQSTSRHSARQSSESDEGQGISLFGWRGEEMIIDYRA